jgi:hypothetical protein
MMNEHAALAQYEHLHNKSRASQFRVVFPANPTLAPGTV